MASQSLTKPLIHDPVAVSPHPGDALCSVFGQRPQIGCALAGMLPEALGASEAELVGRHFDVVTPENCMKPEPIQPAEGAFNFDRPDALVRFAEKRGLDVVGHCLVWHQQCPGWMFLDGDEPAGRELVLQRMRDHIHTVVGRYRGKIRGWDVVNEAVAEPGEYLRKTPWTQRVGEDFVVKAFEFAHEADPDAELYYNDFNIELPGKRERTLRLLRSLQAQGVRLGRNHALRGRQRLLAGFRAGREF